MPQLRGRLATEGWVTAGQGNTQFDAVLEDALKAYQLRHGLRASGVLNGETLQALNTPAAARLTQLARSAERMAELLPLTQKGAYVLVNVPSFELQVVAQGRVFLYSRVIVGKTSTKTPSLHASIRAVDLMPYWHVPSGVAERAIVPAIRKDPTYLARERIRVFSAWGGAEVDPATVKWYAPQANRYLFRQDPGPHNALGLVRLDMPNQFTVYMHDTPMKRLFGSRSRPFSAGCVRVQKRVPPPLPETADELCAVAKNVRAKADDIRLGATATEREVKQLSGKGVLANYRMVHFATHGVLAGQLDGTHEPGLILTPPETATEYDDGYLSASEIASLKLDADWVILSACNTAAGAATNAEALSGLARAFIYAQARALLVSHWEVYSHATVKLITAAIREMASDAKVGRAEAVRRSMLTLIDTGELQEAHPAYWAPFVLVGEGAPSR